MRNTLLTTLAVIGVVTATSSFAQFAQAGEATEPRSQLSAKAWAEVIMRGADTREIVNNHYIDIVNATGSGIDTVTCIKGKDHWQLIGSSPYWSENPKNIPPWKIEVKVNVKSFDGSCPTVTATTKEGDTVEGFLWLSPTSDSKTMTSTSNFTAAAFLVFGPPK